MNMKKYALLFVTIVVNASLSFAGESTLRTKIGVATKDYISNHFLNSTFMFCQGDETLEMGAKGIHSLYGKQLKATEKMPIASATKSMTAASILRLKDKGLLGVNDKVSKYLTKDSGIWDNQQVPAWADKITIHHLLTHTSGLPEYFMAPELAELDLSKPREEVIKGIANFAAVKSLSFEPGSKYEYINTNFTLLGLIIEKVSGTPLEEFYRVELFDPLEMKSTKLISLEEAIKFQQTPQSTEYPVRYFVTPTGGKPHFTEVKPDYIMIPFADGGVVSTTNDLIKWYRGLHRGKILSEDSYNLMTKKHYLAPNKVGITNYTGYGLFISQLQNGDLVYHHAGSAIAIRSESGFIPSKQFYYAVISNVMNYIPKDAADKIDMNLPVNQLDIHYFMQAIFNAIAS